MKTNVSIKFNSVEEYRDIENKLIELGYVNDEGYSNTTLSQFNKMPNRYYCVRIFENLYFFADCMLIDKHYNSLQEFLNDK